MLLAATLIPFFATDIRWKPLSEAKLEDDMSAFLIMLGISVLFFVFLIFLFSKKIFFYKQAKIVWGKAVADKDTQAFVRGFAKAHKLKGYYTVDGNNYLIMSGLITSVAFDKLYEFPVIYDPKKPHKGKVLTELPAFIVKKLAPANGLQYDG